MVTARPLVTGDLRCGPAAVCAVSGEVRPTCHAIGDVLACGRGGRAVGDAAGDLLALDERGGLRRGRRGASRGVERRRAATSAPRRPAPWSCRSVARPCGMTTPWYVRAGTPGILPLGEPPGPGHPSCGPPAPDRCPGYPHWCSSRPEELDRVVRRLRIRTRSRPPCASRATCARPLGGPPGTPPSTPRHVRRTRLRGPPRRRRAPRPSQRSRRAGPVSSARSARCRPPSAPRRAVRRRHPMRPPTRRPRAPGSSARRCPRRAAHPRRAACSGC